MKELRELSLALLFTGGVGLKTWAEIGSLDRELAIYRALLPMIGRIAFITYGGRAEGRFRKQLGAIELLPSIWTPSRWFNYHALWIMYRSALSRYDIVKTNQLAGSEVGVWLKKKYRCRLIIRCGYVPSWNLSRESVEPRILQRAMNMERVAFHEADIGVVTTQASLDYVISHYSVAPDKMRIIPNYVDTQYFLPRPPNAEMSDPPTLVFVGRLATEKNLRALLKALSLLKAQRKFVPRLVMIGNGPLRNELGEMALAEKLPVTFLGNVPNRFIPSELWKATAFILPSLYEGHPKALLEAMGSGLPCIGANVSGIREEIAHRKTGFLCETTPESIADAIDTVFSDGSLQKEMGDNARTFVMENYALGKILQAELKVLQSLSPA